MFKKNAQEIEGSIDVEMRSLNEVISIFNEAIRSFPANIHAGWFGAVVKERHVQN